MARSRCLAVLFLFGSAVDIGCAVRNDRNEDGNDAGGSTKATEICLSVCERARECPDAAPLDCAESCSTYETELCATEAYIALECLSRGDVCDPLPPECVDELDGYYACIENQDPVAGCFPENAPSSASCETICAGGPFSCFESEAACVQSCSNGSARSELVTCASEYQVMLGCISTCADICALTPDDCVDARSAFLACDARYCEANPDSESCRIETI